MSNVLAMDPTVEQWFVPKCDKDLSEDQQFRIKYKYLPARDEAALNDKTLKSTVKGKNSSYEYLVNSADLKRCELTIQGWENFNYPPNHPTKAGQAVPFSKDSIGMIPQNIRAEYVDFITKRKEIAEDEPEDDMTAGVNLGEAKTE